MEMTQEVEFQFEQVMRHLEEECQVNFEEEKKPVGGGGRPRLALGGVHHPRGVERQAADRWAARMRAKVRRTIALVEARRKEVERECQCLSMMQSALEKKVNQIKTPEYQTVVVLQPAEVSPAGNHLLTPLPTQRRSSLSRKRSPSPH